MFRYIAKWMNKKKSKRLIIWNGVSTKDKYQLPLTPAQHLIFRSFYFRGIQIFYLSL